MVFRLTAKLLLSMAKPIANCQCSLKLFLVGSLIAFNIINLFIGDNVVDLFRFILSH